MKSKRLFNIRNYRFFIKFIISVLLTSGISVVILTGIIFNWMKGKMLDDIEQINTNELLVIGTAFQGYIDDAQHTTMSLYQNLNIKNVMLSGDTSWSSSYYNAISQIRNILTVNQTINSVYVINTDGIVFKIAKNTETEEAQQELFRMITSGDYSVGKPIPWQMISQTGIPIQALTVFFRENISQSGTFSGAIAVNINWDILQKKLFSDHSNRKITILDDAGNIIIRSYKSSFLLPSDLKENILSSSRKSGTFRAPIEAQDTLISYAAISDGKFFIISETNYQNSIRELTNGRNFLLKICFCIILTIFVVSLLISYLICLPMDHVIHHIQTLFQNSADSPRKTDMTLITGTLTNIAERMNSLEKKQQENTIVNLLTTVPEQILPDDFMLSSGIISKIGAPFMLLLIRLHDYHSFFSNHSQESSSFMMNSVCALATEYLSDDHLICNAYPTSKDCITLILSSAKDNFDLHSVSISDIGSHIACMLQDVLALDVTIGFSPITTDVTQLNRLYTEAYTLTNSKVFYPHGMIFTEAAFSEADNSLSVKIDCIQEEIKTASADSFALLLSDLLACCQKYNYKTAIHALIRLAVSILQLSAEVSAASVRNINYSSVHNELSSLYDYSQITAYFQRIFDDYTARRKEADTMQTRDLIERSLSYLSANYSNPDLSANMMAEHLFISTGHFSRIFNEVTGCTFPDYLTHIRMEHAKELLKSDKMNIYEIATAVGYSSASYFSSSFRKEYGISPSKYRLQILHKDNIE